MQEAKGLRTAGAHTKEQRFTKGAANGPIGSPN
jgi:hypothetical protein